MKIETLLNSMIDICDLLDKALDYVAANYGDSSIKNPKNKNKEMRNMITQFKKDKYKALSK